MAGGREKRQIPTGEEEEDYMADLSLFLPPEALSSSENKKPPASAPDPSLPKLKKPKSLSWQEQRKLDRERKQLDEDERTRVGLESAIPPSNIGFKMLQMMGYSPGTALGKDRHNGGRTEPVGLEIRRSRAGIGRETPAEERVRKDREREDRERNKEEMDRLRMEEAREEFGNWQRMQFRIRRVVRDFRKADAVLAQLENREDVEEERDREDGEKGDEEEEEEEVITEEDLRSILMKLRDEHNYCLYCGFKYESAQDLEANCPGLEEDDH